MVLKKILSLKNVGRFTSLTPAGDVEFKRLTLIYGLNGYGKTTLVGVLRSLASGDRAYVDERHTLGVADEATAEIRLEKGTAKFSKGAWSTTETRLEIFDSTFVNDNVFTGEHVGSEHRKNLYEVVVGAAAVQLVKEIDELDVEARKIATENSKIEGTLREKIQAPFSIDDFIALSAVPDLTQKIADCTTQLSAVRKQREILARGQLDALSAPALPQLQAVLGKSVAEVSKAAEERVRRHLQRLDHRGEAWIRQGVSYLEDEEVCPFCGQDTASVDLLKLYSEYFSNAYRENVVEIERSLNQLDQTFGDMAVSSVQKRVLANDACIQGWADLADLSAAGFVFDGLEQAWRHVRGVMRDRLQRKVANPTRSIAEDAELAAAVKDYEDARGRLVEHNSAVQAANLKIGDLKQQAAGIKAETLEEELRRLRNMEIRTTLEVDGLVAKLISGRARRQAIDEGKKELKAKLETTAAGILASYQAAINRLLQGFGANFSVTNARPSFAGGKASSTYQIELNDVEIDIGDARTPRGTPCFRTALSTGDKSTLALAFFLARLEQEPDIAKKCVIIDDPLSSFDSFRATYTQHEVAVLARRAAQAVVLSHDERFLDGVMKNSEKTTTTTLQIVRDGETHVLRPWDVAKYFLEAAHQEYFLMKSFLEDGPPKNGDLTSVARAIRPYLEWHLRQRYPDEFPAGTWLADFIDKIEAAPARTGLAGIGGRLADLKAINSYSKVFHHGSTSPAPRPTDAELRPWVAKAIAFVQSA